MANSFLSANSLTANSLSARSGVDPFLSLRSIHKSFRGRAVLQDICLDVAAEEWIVLLGSSGSGKSTLLKLIAGLEEPDRGSIMLHGKDALSLPPSKRDCAFSFQSHACYDHWTVKQNLESVLDPRVARDTEWLIEAFELTKLLASRPPQLSGGELGRVSLLRALLSPKRLLLLDEPLAQLNPRFRSIAKDAITKIHRTRKRTTLYVTHDLHEAMTLADRIAILEDGEIQALGPPHAIYEELVSKASDYVAAGVGCDQLLACGSRRVLPSEWKILAIESPASGFVSFDDSFSKEGIHVGHSRSPRPSACVHQGYSLMRCRWAGGFWELVVSTPNPMILHVADSPWLPSSLTKTLRDWEDKIEPPIAIWISHAQ